MAKTTVPGFLPTLGHRVCCLMSDRLELIHDIPVFGHICPGIMVDLSGSRLKHRAGTGVWGMVFRRELSARCTRGAGGFIDLGHLRDYADLTRRYYYALVRQAKNGVIPSGTQLDLLQSHGQYRSRVHPRDIPAANATHLKGIVDVARSIFYDVSVIDEIQTWAQTRVGGRSSSLSPEDLVANYLGTRTRVTSRSAPRGSEIIDCSSRGPREPSRETSAFQRVASEARRQSHWDSGAGGRREPVPELHDRAGEKSSACRRATWSGSAPR